MRAKDILLPAAILGGLASYAWASLPRAVFISPTDRMKIEQSVYYSGCDEARAAGKAPIQAGQPGYREGLDGDGDGIACEPIRTY
ncbi:MAG: excalibur calcium-binding domain-containing protein [Sphingomicrobium sp.]